MGRPQRRRISETTGDKREDARMGVSAAVAATDRGLSQPQLGLLALEGIVHVVRELARRHGGAVVLLDDLHAADPESVEVARYLASAQIGGVAVVAAMRPVESPLADRLVD